MTVNNDINLQVHKVKAQTNNKVVFTAMRTPKLIFCNYCVVCKYKFCFKFEGI
jgi:hypothetical protein